MGCRGSKPAGKAAPPRGVAREPEEIPATQGCYLTYDDEELFCKWANEDPEGTVIVFAKAGKLILAGRLARPARLLGKATDSASFYKGLIQFVLEVAPFQCELTIRGDAPDNAYEPFLFGIHQPGNQIIGDRTLKCLPGKLGISLDTVDGVAAVPLDSTVFDQRAQTLAEFIDGARSAGGAYTQLDASGRPPPLS